MNGRRADALIVYNGTDISSSLGSCLTSVKYTDEGDGKSDALDINIADRDGKWIGAWAPEKGDTVSGRIKTSDWAKVGDSRGISTGKMIVDNVSASGSASGPKVTVQIGAVSKPSDSSFSTAKRSKTWENVTLQEIAAEIASKYGLSLKYDGGSVPIAAKEQSKETDSAFLAGLCENYGFILKTYASKLVVFEKARYRAKAATLSINRADCSTWSWQDTLEGTFTGGKITYTDPDTGEDIEYQTGSPKRLFECNIKAASVADAERILAAAVAMANDKERTMKLTVFGNPSVVAGMNVKLSGWNSRIDGKFYVAQAVHSVGGGAYTTALDLQKI